MVLDWKWGHRSWEDWISKGKMMENGRRTGTRGQMTACHLPTMLHVLWFVHTYGQFDLQILVRARLGHSHLVELWLLGTVRSWVEDDLHSDITKDNTADLSRSWIFDLGSCSAALLVYLQELAISIYLTVFESGRESERQSRALLHVPKEEA